MKFYVNWKCFVALGIVVLLIPILLQYIVFANSIISNISNDGWASFFGSYIGGIIGGGMTLIAVLISIQETRRIQSENERLQKRKERIEFCDNVSELVGRYCADISKFFYDCKLRTGSENRIVSIECFYILSIKLNNIDDAKILVNELADIHDKVMQYRTIECSVMEEDIARLRNIAAKFINSYVNSTDLAS